MLDIDDSQDNDSTRASTGGLLAHRTLTAPRHISLQGKWDQILPDKTKGKSKGRGRKGRGKLTELVSAQPEDLSTAEIKRVSTPIKPMTFKFGHLLQQ